MARLAHITAGACLSLALLLAVSSARAGSCGETCHTVCPDGCDFPSPAACALGAADSETCLTYGGHYTDTVTYSTEPLVLRSGLRFVCDDPLGDPCVIDGDGVRAHGFRAYRGWVIDGFEVRNTTDDAITAHSSRLIAAVRNCWVHDVGGEGITNVDANSVVEFNRLERTFGTGISCTRAGTIIRNNLVVDVALGGGRGISCSTTGSEILHNTVDIRSATAPYAGGAPYGIIASTARYNIVLGGDTALQATVASAENLVFDWDSAPYGGAAGGASDAEGFPQFFHREDYHLMAGSPAIDAATTSTETVDLDSDPRDVPDIGAFEWSAGDTATGFRWPVNQRVVDLDVMASPSLAYVPDDGPAIAYFDVDAASVVYAVRRVDGSWVSEIVASGVTPPEGVYLSQFRRIVDLAVDPTSGETAVAWVEEFGPTGFRVRHARLHGDVCAPADCVSPRWSGCTAAPIFEGNGRAAVDLELSPVDGAPSALVLYEEWGACGVSGERFRAEFRTLAGDMWTGETLSTSACGAHLGNGAALALDPVTGAAHALYPSAADNEGTLVHASNESGTFVVADVPIGDDTFTFEVPFALVATAFSDDGTLAVAFTERSPSGSHGFAYIERVDGLWSGPSLTVDVMGGTGIRPTEGLSLAFQDGDTPHMAYARNGSMRHASRTAGDWNFEIADGARVTGVWTQLAFCADGAPCIAYQREGNGGSIRFLARGAVGGGPPGPLGVCDDGDPCTESQCHDTLGCIHPEVDCNDDDVCTLDRCHPEDGCVYDAFPCADDDPCTDDACDSVLGCVFPPADCDDGDPCTIDRCSGSVGCEHVTEPCLDDNPCTAGSCEPGVGCVFTAIPGPCDDGDPATVDDECVDGVCAGRYPPLVLPLVIEVVVVDDVPNVDGPPAPLVLPLIVETIAVADSEDAFVDSPPPAVVLPVVVETVVVTDDRLVEGPSPPVVLPTIVETIAVADESDAQGPSPPVVLPVVVEAIAVADESLVEGPPRPVVLPIVVETVAVADVQVVEGPPAPLVLPVVVEYVTIDDGPHVEVEKPTPGVDVSGDGGYDDVSVGEDSQAPSSDVGTGTGSSGGDCSAGGPPPSGAVLPTLLLLVALSLFLRRRASRPSRAAPDTP